VINTSPNQAFTAGYREGVKMSLDQGSSINPAEFMSKMYRPNLKCLTTWMSVGADVENGKYAMLGARIGCWQTVIQKFEPEVVRDLDDINDRFDELDGEVDELIELYGNSLRQRLGITIADYDDEQSSFFKFCQPQWINKGVQDREQKYL
jgi:hypothetical protein